MEQAKICSTIEQESNSHTIILGVAEYRTIVFALYANQMLLIIG